MEDILAKLKNKDSVEISGAGGNSSKAYLLSKIFAEYAPDHIFYWIGDSTQEDLISKNLELFSDYQVLKLSPESLDSPEENQKNQIEILSALFQIQSQKKTLLLLSQDDFFRDAPDPDSLRRSSFEISTQDQIEITPLFEKLLEMGYSPTPMTLPEPGTFLRRGGILDIFPVNSETPIRIELGDEQISSIHHFDPLSNKTLKPLDSFTIYPINIAFKNKILDYLDQRHLLIIDELEESNLGQSSIEEHIQQHSLQTIKFSSFAESDDCSHQRYSTVLRYHDLTDLEKDLRKKKELGWKIIINTERAVELQNFFKEREMIYDKKIIQNEPDFRAKLDESDG